MEGQTLSKKYMNKQTVRFTMTNIQVCLAIQFVLKVDGGF